MSGEVIRCLNVEPEFDIRDGIVFVSAGDWGMCVPLRIAKHGVARLSEVIAEYESRRAEVTRLPVQHRG